jgi:peptidoglycan/xylan/chitin deacetylase (PgdA/CDA1 family)
MRWPEIEALDRSLITVGSHTSTHPILPSLDDRGIERELGGSLAELRAHGLAQDRPLLCYPNGDHDYRVLEAARRHYHGACMTTKGLVNAGTAPHELPRIGANSPLHDVAWRMWRAAS